MEASQRQRFMRFEEVERSHVGCRRKVNEDALLARQDLGLWAVADGVGGQSAGDLASALVVERLGRVAAGPELVARKLAARAAIEEANLAIWKMACANSGTMGSTVVALAIGDGGYSLSVGRRQPRLSAARWQTSATHA